MPRRPPQDRHGPPGGLTTAYEYDLLGRLVKVANPYGQAIEYRYDAAGSREQLIAPHGTVNYTFDELNRISTVTDQGGRVTRYEYDAASRLERTEYGNGMETICAYDTLGRLKELVNREIGGAAITCYGYTVVPAGYRTRIEENEGTANYGYDGLYRLILHWQRNP